MYGTIFMSLNDTNDAVQLYENQEVVEKDNDDIALPQNSYPKPVTVV